MKKQPGFTLIEMLMVIVIIGILFAMTLGFGSSRISDLDKQSVSDQFVDSFSTIVGQSRTSSYLYGQKYDSLLVQFVSGKSEISANFSGITDFKPFSILNLSTFVIDSIVANSIIVPSLDVELKPYGIGCQTFSNSLPVSDILLKATIVKQPVCYTLQSDLCVLKKVQCPN